MDSIQPDELLSRAAMSRERYLNTLRALQDSGPAQLQLRDGGSPKHASSIKSIHPESGDVLVVQLKTPLGVVPAAIIRGSDILHMEIDCKNEKLGESKASDPNVIQP